MNINKLHREYQTRLTEETLSKGKYFAILALLLYIPVVWIDYSDGVMDLILILRLVSMGVFILYIILGQLIFPYKKHWIIPVHTLLLCVAIGHFIFIGITLHSQPDQLKLFADNFTGGFIGCLFICSMFSFGSRRQLFYILPIMIFIYILIITLNGTNYFRHVIVVSIMTGFMMVYLRASWDAGFKSFRNIKSLESQEKELKQINRELKIAHQRQQDINRALSDDLKSPLRSIGGFANLLKRKLATSDDTEIHEFLEIIIGESKQMNSLLDDILNLSQLSFSKTIPTVPVSLEKVLNRIIFSYHNDLEDGKVKIQIPNASLPWIYMTEKRLLFLMKTLVENGIKYNKSPIPTIFIDYSVTDSDFIIRVRDNGIGIESEYIEKIFEVFMRLHPKEEFEGTGISLASCKEIVLQEEGHIWVESIKGEGSIFYVQLPREKISLEPPTQNIKQPSSTINS